MMQLSDLDINLKRAVFSALAILTILFGLILAIRFVVYVLFFASLIGTGIIAYDLFLKKYVVLMRKNKASKKKQRLDQELLK
jgi:hypothetical protein